MKKNLTYLKYFLILVFALLYSPFVYGKILFTYLHGLMGKKKSGIFKVLVIQTARIGDMVCTTPMFREIKRQHPAAELVVLCTPKTEGIIRNNKYIDEVITYDLNHFQGPKKTFQLIQKVASYNFDVSISVWPGTQHYLVPFFAAIPKRIGTYIPEHSFLGHQIFSIFNTNNLNYAINTLTVKHFLDLLRFIGVTNYSLKKEVYADQASTEKADDFFRKNNLTKNDFVVGIGVGCGNKRKAWDPRKFAQLADLIIKKYNHKVILRGGPGEGEVVECAARHMREKALVSYNDFDLRELPALFRRFKVYISVDSGPLYIANALDVPVVDIIGPVSMYDQAPIYEKCEVAKVENLPCWPCYFVIPRAGKPPDEECCARCLTDLKASDVFGAFEKIIQKYYN